MIYPRRTRIPGYLNTPHQQLAGYNLIKNPTFDSDVSDWSATAPATIVWDASGELRVYRNRAAWGTHMCYQDVSVEAGEWYILGFDYTYENASATTINVGASWSGGAIVTLLEVAAPTDDNTKMFQAQTNSLRLVISPANKSTGRVGVDNVLILKIELPDLA